MNKLIQIIRQSLYGMLEIRLINEIAPRVADYLLAHGVMILPCKVGDTVYDYEARAYKIDRINFYARGLPVLIGTRDGSEGECGVTATWNVDRIGKTVFLTREAAEAHLEEMKEDRNVFCSSL